ncbi:MAG: immunity 63 family protein [Streptomyces sp.]|nr:immunity 63 family protein [Streptomyces sp.]
MSTPPPQRRIPDTKALKDAWSRIAAGSDVLDDSMLPPVDGPGDDLVEGEPAVPEGLFLFLDEEGVVRGMRVEDDDDDEVEVFASGNLDEVLYMVAEEVTGVLAAEADGAPDEIAEHARLLDRVDPAWGARFRAVDEASLSPCGRDPREAFAWVAGGWRDQYPYTTMEFLRADEALDPARVAALFGADPEQIAAGTSLADVGGEPEWGTMCFGAAGDWVFVLYHELPPGARVSPDGLKALGVRDWVTLSACMAKAIYTFDYYRDGRRMDDDAGILELIWYNPGRSLYCRHGDLEFLNRALRRAELDHPEETDRFTLYFHALETGLGLSLPRVEFEEGTVRAVRWAS